MVEKIEKIESASTKKEVRSAKQEVNIPLRINITRGWLKVKFSFIGLQLIVTSCKLRDVRRKIIQLTDKLIHQFTNSPICQFANLPIYRLAD